MSLGTAPRRVSPGVRKTRSARTTTRPDVCWVSVEGCSEDEGVNSYRIELPSVTSQGAGSTSIPGASLPTTSRVRT